MSQPLEALGTANDNRLDRSRIRHGLRSGTLSLAVVLEDPPASVLNMTLFDLCRVRRNWRLGSVGQRAVEAGVNLGHTVAKAPAFALYWLAAQDDPSRPTPARRAPVVVEVEPPDWCATCSERTSLTDSGRCLWCGSDLEVAA